MPHESSRSRWGGVAGIVAKLVVSMLLGLLGPHPNFVHVGYQIIGPYLFKLSEWSHDSQFSKAGYRDTVYAFVQAYAIYCAIIFIILLFVTRRR
jgi:hypothetical protein